MVTFCLSILFFSSCKTFVRDTCQGPDVRTRGWQCCEMELACVEAGPALPWEHMTGTVDTGLEFLWVVILGVRVKKLALD